MSTATHSASRAMPALPGAQTSLSVSGLAAIFQASACSRPPEPRMRMFMGRGGGLWGGSLFGVAWRFALARDSTDMAEPGLKNVVEWTVSDLSTALRKTVEDAYGYVRVRGEV